MKEKIKEKAKIVWQKAKELFAKAKEIAGVIWEKGLTWIKDNPDKVGIIAGLIYCGCKCLGESHNENRIEKYHRSYNRFGSPGEKYEEVGIRFKY